METLQEFARARGVPETAAFNLALALEECGSNIVEHAFQRDARRKFQVAFEHRDRAFIIELRDDGPAFDPTAAAPRSPADDAPPGGWGIPLVRRFMDETLYRRDGGENVLRLTKFLREPSAPENHFAPTPNQPEPEFNMSLNIQIQHGIIGSDTATLTVKLSGSLDTVTAPELEQRLGPVLAGPVTDLVFDLADLKFISSAGLRVFAVARKLLKDRGGQIAFLHLQPQIQEVFEIIKSLPGVALFSSMDELDRYLAARQASHLEQF